MSIKKVSCGVLEGSALCHILFLNHKNDLQRVCKNIEVSIFADDAILSAMDTSLDDIYADLQSVSDCLTSNKLFFYKTVVLNVGNPASSSINLSKHCSPVQLVLSSKYIGVVLECEISFQTHIEYNMKQLSTQ